MPGTNGTPSHAHLHPDVQFLLKYLEQICGRVGEQKDNYLFLKEVLKSRGVSGQLKVHNKLEGWYGAHPDPADNNAFQILYEVCEELQRYVDEPDVVELCYILTRPNMRAVLNIHDQVANQEYEPEIPEFPADEVSSSDDEDTNIKVVRLVKSVEPLAVFFLLAGYDTTNTALCMTSYLLAVNKKHQEKLIQEVDEFAPRREDVTYETLSKMEYLDCVVRESLRFYPPTAGGDRRNDKGDIVIKGTLIPKGFSIWIPIYAIHHDPENWEEPEEFRPERFNKENRANIRPVSWLPFGDGPRSCIGMRLALMEIKFALVRMLQVFQFETCPETEIPPDLNTTSAFLSPPNGVKLQVVQRKKTD